MNPHLLPYLLFSGDDDAPAAPPIVLLPPNRIAVDQPPAGDQYPFLHPSEDARRLVGDAYVAYADPACDLKLPLQIGWLAGLGAVGNANQAGRPAPTHDQDVVIEDADGNVVFDSTTATAFSSTPWGDNKQVLQWERADSICRLVWFLDAVADYDDHLEPASAILDPRTSEPLPRRVRSLRVEFADGVDAAGPFSGRNLILQAGFSTELSVEELAAVDGGRRVTEITISAVPGAGLGRSAGCSTTPVIRRIRGQPGDARGHFLLDGQGCYRLEPVTAVSSLLPRELVQTLHALKLSNDCQACCQCSDYLNMYEAARRLATRVIRLSARAEAVRDQHRENLKRWLLQGRARVSNPLRLAIGPATNCLVDVAGAFCNLNGDFRSNLELRFSFVYHDFDYPDVTADTALPGTLVCGTSFRSGNSSPGNPRQAGRVSPNARERYTLAGAWPVYKAFFQGVPRAGLATASFQVVLDDCTTQDQVELVLEAFDPSTGARLQVDTLWPSGDGLQPVGPLKVLTPVFKDDPCESV